LASVFNGIVRVYDIIAFVFVVGGAFYIVIESGAINAALGGLIRKLSGKEYIFIIIIMTAFAIPGATFGMAEETLPFVALMAAVSKALGWDSIVGVSLVTVGVYAGYAAGPLGPFSIGIAHGIAELPIFSGLGLRTLLCVGGLAIAIHHTVKYAQRIKEDPTGSFVYEVDSENAKEELTFDDKLTNRHKLILAILVISLGALVYGVLKFEWWFEEIASLFMLMGIVVGMIAFNGDFNRYAEEFMKGASTMTSAALLIGFSRGVLVVMEDGKIMDTIVYALSLPLHNLHGIFAAWGMFLSQGLINFAIPSSSGQAVVVMPILSPLADLIGVTRQVACQAYQSGDGYWNMITPTHPTLMAALGIAGVSFGKWLKFAGPLVLKWGLWTLVILTIGVLINWGPF
jgi:uncharacterized ion transporter superfamily protein YfcC